MTGHCFISYSTADGIEFTRKIADKLTGGDPSIPAWYDKRDLRTGEDWDEQIVEAIKESKAFLFVMSIDSTAKASNCKPEILRALKYKKPIAPILLHKDAEMPLLLGTRQWIDFTSDFEKGLAQLRDFWRELDSPAGQLRALKDRLADAEHALRRASSEEENRIKSEIEELKAAIKSQEDIVKDPKAAQEKTQRSIEAGLERERKPEKPLAVFQSSKFINQPPGVAQNYFQDRLMETEQAILFLKNEAQRVLTVVGRGGAGKTAMTCRLLKYIENGGLPDDYDKKHDKVEIDGIVYLSEAGSRKVNFANLFDDLCKLLPAASAEKLSTLYREPQTSTESKTVQLLAAFQGLKQVIVLLDNFENVVDAEKGQVRDAELDEALRAILHAPHHPVKIIITTRVSARELDAFEPARQRLLPLDTGLPPEYAREAFVLMDEGNLVGIKNAGAELLNLAVTRTLGLPRALEALYAALRTDRFTTLQELLDLPILPEQVVQAYVGEAFNRLDTNAQKVMQALAVYNRPVTPAAVDYLLAPHVPAIVSAPILQRLANMHFARKESGRFYLHPADREFAFGLIFLSPTYLPKLGEEQGVSENFTQYDLTSRAADYFAQARKPKEEWKNLDDIASLLAEFDLRCSAGDYDTAASVLRNIDFNYLFLWGHFRLSINMRETIEGKISDVDLQLNNLKGLDRAYAQIGMMRESISFSNKGIIICREINDYQQEGVFLSGLGSRYAFLGDIEKAIEFQERALLIAQEIGDRKGEGVRFHNLGIRYTEVGNSQKAIEYYDQALKIVNDLGRQRHKANLYIDKALALDSLGDFQKAKELLLQSVQMADEMSNLNIQHKARYRLAQAYLSQNDLVTARTTIEVSLQYDVPNNNHNASALHGIIALRQGEEVTARGAFVRAIGQADEILSKTAEYYSALDAKGLSICGMILCDGRGGSRSALTDAAGRGDPSMPAETNDGKTVPPDKSTVSAGRVAPTVDDAIETFKKARKIAPHAGVVKSVLRLFDELVKCDTDGLLKGVREVIEATPLVE